MSDYSDYDNGDDSRRRRRRNYTDDAWGMAEYEDYHDGSAGDAEDYAGGLVPEERPHRRYDDPSSEEAADNQYTVASNAPENQWRSQHIGRGSSDGVDQAARLLQRMNERNSYPASRHPTAPPRPSAAPSAARPQTTEQGASAFMIGIILLLLVIVMSCLILGFYVIFG